MSSCWHCSQDLARLTCLIWPFSVTGRPRHRASLPLEEMGRRDEPKRLQIHHKLDKGKSIWKKFEKRKGEAKVENGGKLYFRINKKTGRPGVRKFLEFSSMRRDSQTSYGRE